jgi:hypothetical protein
MSVGIALCVETPSGKEPWFEFRHKARFVWKTITLLVTFVALIPILLYKSELGATWYLGFLVAVHVIGLVVFGWGVAREDIAPTTWGLVGRLIGIVSVGILLYFVADGLKSSFGSAVFWTSLFGLWAIHTGGLLLVHLRGRPGSGCPFL